MQKNELETGTVIGTEGNFATVITNKSKSCNECGKAQAGVCGKGGAMMVMKVKNTLGAKKGETVLLELDRKTLIRGYFIFFILPIVILFFSTFAGYKLSHLLGIKGLEILAGFTGLVVALFYSFKKIRNLGRTAQLHITEILYQSSGLKDTANLRPEDADYLAAFSRNN
jgi:sigma-E factor negative regulatory protein RseC